MAFRESRTPLVRVLRTPQRVQRWNPSESTSRSLSNVPSLELPNGSAFRLAPAHRGSCSKEPKRRWLLKAWSSEFPFKPWTSGLNLANINDTPIIWYHDICFWDLERLLAKIHFLKSKLKQIIQRAVDKLFWSFCRLQIIAKVWIAYESFGLNLGSDFSLDFILGLDHTWARNLKGESSQTGMSSEKFRGEKTIWQKFAQRKSSGLSSARSSLLDDPAEEFAP